MNEHNKPKEYREFIDAIVENCHHGQGQVGPNRVKEGIWNSNATQDFLTEQFKINELLSRLSAADRATLASLIKETFTNGVFETIKTLEEHEISPFIGGYEGSPYHDFIARLDKDVEWEWPES